MNTNALHTDPLFKPTDIRTFKADNGDIIITEVENSTRKLQWRMTVNGNVGPTYSYYQGIYQHSGWCLATTYWDGTFPEFIPFTFETATEEK